MRSRLSRTAPPTIEHFDVSIVRAGISAHRRAYHLTMQWIARTFVVLEAQDRLAAPGPLADGPGIRSVSDLSTLAIASSRGPPRPSRPLRDPALHRRSHRENASVGTPLSRSRIPRFARPAMSFVKTISATRGGWRRWQRSWQLWKRRKRLPRRRWRPSRVDHPGPHDRDFGIVQSISHHQSSSARRFCSDVAERRPAWCCAL